ncbi:MAG: hypothetical protein D6755_13560, partial [Anaerolineae bacterium]
QPLRTRYRRQALIAMARLAECYGRAGKPQRMEALARRQLHIDPEREIAHSQFMRAYLAQGEHRAALRHYAEYERQLEADGLQPTLTLRMYRERALAYREERVAPLEIIPHNLPPEETPFYGRQEELDDLLMWLVAPDQRLLTITGLGGIGKTRLALAAARHLVQAHATIQPRFPGGVWFVSLAELEEGDFEAVGEIISKYCHCPAQPHETVHEALVRHFGSAPSLLILDNLEHLPVMPEVVAALLASIPDLTILATSRHPLKIQCETTRRLRGLPTPENERDLTAPSVVLLSERLARVNGDFRSAPGDILALTSICRTLEGWPLALELAASWGDRLSVREIAGRIASDVGALQVSMPDLPPRHRSIAAALSGSFTLLTPQQQRILMRFAVFHGGCTLEAAEAILGASQEDLALLVRRALLKEQETRYTMHELIRQFALNELERSGERAEALRVHA